ncbi:MAG TPA: hypothetical protein VFQ91_04085 [Bryobacteraceae bacterium]|nr:hypothetical protein [Bryobacteraceae bacterium]
MQFYVGVYRFRIKRRRAVKEEIAKGAFGGPAYQDDARTTVSVQIKRAATFIKTMGGRGDTTRAPVVPLLQSLAPGIEPIDIGGIWRTTPEGST